MFELIRRILAAFNPNRTSTLRNPTSWLLESFGGSTDSGVEVTRRSLLSYAPLWYAINRISGHVGILPCRLLQRVAEDIREVGWQEFPEIRLVNRKPNEFMTGVDFRETVQSHAIIDGNGRAGIVRNGLGQAVELIPFAPETTQTYLLYREGMLTEKWHYTTTADGRQIPIPDRDVLHIKGLAADGLVGYSLVSLARESIGGALAAEKFVNKSYRNDGRPSLVLEAPKDAFRNDEHARDFLKEFHSHHGGLDNVNKPGLLRYGVTAREISQTATDGQFIENRRISREEAALWTAIESMLGVEKAESYNSLMQRNSAYLQNCLARWLVKWEQELDLKLLSARQRAAGYYWKFDTYALLSGSIRERYETLQLGRTMGLIGQLEARRMENLGALDPNDDYGNPNTSSSSSAGSADASAGTDTNQADGQANGQAAGNGEELKRLESAALLQLAHEGSALREHARRPAGFLGRVDEYYTRVEPKIISRLHNGGLAAVDAQRWVQVSREQVLELAGRVHPEGLAAGIEDLINRWARERVPQLLQPRLEHSNHAE